MTLVTPLGEAKRIHVTSFGAEGSIDESSEWVVGVSDTRVGFWTPDVTEWQTRIAHSPVVSLQQCDGRGKPDREQPLFEGRVEILTEGDLCAEVTKRTKEKYGFGTFVAGVVDRVKEIGGDKTPEGVVLVNIVG